VTQLSAEVIEATTAVRAGPGNSPPSVGDVGAALRAEAPCDIYPPQPTAKDNGPTPDSPGLRIVGQHVHHSQSHDRDQRNPDGCPRYVTLELFAYRHCNGLYMERCL
jgi:hypothetical protein